ncbi:unnamed protein product [Clonostachys rhizophaga]|uniref:Uncharacterized protein n=1 Tax=Clonostachys rhizophaga TaxID=160324 RepID=A0A9N9V2I5_9HYPO|nr:unnamed protein product [Clonostachys rhizophaga]
MDVRTLSRPATQLLRTTTHQTTLLPLTTSRGHKTTARTKRALKIPPHDSFLPNRSQPFPAADHIIYNPPASEASPEHTPFIFLPSNDPRREAIQRMRLSSPEALGSVAGASPPQNDADLPPAMSYPRRRAQYNLTEDDMAEMRRLRNEDPLTWSTNALSKKFNCSPIIVSIAAPAPAEHKKWLEEKAERRRERWGPIKTQAREDRGRRAEMLYRGEI